MDSFDLSYDLMFDERPGYLHALVRAETMTVEMALEYLRRIAEKCSDLNCRRLLLERDVPVMLPTGDLYITTVSFLEMIRATSVAFVNPHITIDEDMDFAMLIGTNRGANYKLFNNVSDASEWLLG